MLDKGYINEAREPIQLKGGRGKRVTRQSSNKRHASQEPEEPVKANQQKILITVNPTEGSHKDTDLSRQLDQEEDVTAQAGPSTQTDIYGFP